MEHMWRKAGEQAEAESLPASFPEWVLREVDRLLEARAQATSRQERAQLDLKLALIHDAAQRYGDSLAEASEI